MSRIRRTALTVFTIVVAPLLVLAATTNFETMRPQTGDDQLMTLQKMLTHFNGGTDVTWTPTVTRATAGGSTAAGNHAVRIVADPTFAGTVAGVAVTSADNPIVIDAGNNKLPAIAYTRTAGSLLIVELK